MSLSDDDFKKIKQKAMSYCARSEKCFVDVLKNLSKYNLSDSELRDLKQYLESENFINEARYSEAFVNDKFKFNKWGRQKIYYGLISKDIPANIANQALDLIDKDEYFNMLKSILNSKLKTINSDDPVKIKQMLVRYAYSKGFEWEVIEKVMSKMGLFI